MVFKNREEAGARLVEKLRAYANLKDLVVLGIPRGGVPVAFEVARTLNAPLDVCLARKLGVPDQEELAFGAIAPGGIRYLNQSIVQAAGISTEEIDRITAEAARKLQDRSILFRGDKPPLQLEGRTVILIDDGIATGASMHAAVLALRQMHPAKLVVAVPVAPIDTCGWLRPYVDELVCLDNPLDFYAVGQFYEYFPQVSDEEVLDVLRRAASLPLLPLQAATAAVADRPRGKDEAAAVAKGTWNGSRSDVSIAVDDVHLAGMLVIPQNAQGIVLFVHGSGSSRNSPRNRHVAEVLQHSGLATLLFDLLTSEEDEIDRWSAELRFNIGLLSRRLVQVTQWVRQLAGTRDLAIGYFGASTGAAAALTGAAELRDQIGAVVSRGGRPDLAREALGKVSTPTLLLVGSLDEDVLELNRQALAKLSSKEKELRVIPGATHLFEEPGTLDQVAKAAADWFNTYLTHERYARPERADTIAEQGR